MVLNSCSLRHTLFNMAKMHKYITIAVNESLLDFLNLTYVVTEMFLLLANSLKSQILSKKGRHAHNMRSPILLQRQRCNGICSTCVLSLRNHFLSAFLFVCFERLVYSFVLMLDTVIWYFLIWFYYYVHVKLNKKFPFSWKNTFILKVLLVLKPNFHHSISKCVDYCCKLETH